MVIGNDGNVNLVGGLKPFEKYKPVGMIIPIYTCMYTMLNGIYIL